MEEPDLTYRHLYVIDAVLIYARQEALALLVAELASEVYRSLCSLVYQASVLVPCVESLAHDEDFARSVVDDVFRGRTEGVAHILFG